MGSSSGVIHKPRGQLRGVSQMTILLHKSYLIKVTTKGGGGSKIPKNLTTWFMDDPKDNCHLSAWSIVVTKSNEITP